jgi:4-amino-4-deoxy-L-arabinose transferase-like glycosyltransferase
MTMAIQEKLLGRLDLKTLLIAFLLALSGLFPFNDRVTVNSALLLTIQSSAPTSVQVFCDAGTGFNEHDSVIVSPTAGERPLFEIPLVKSCAKLRLDLNGPVKDFEILGAEIRTSAGDTLDVLSGFEKSRTTNDLNRDTQASNRFVVTGADPWLVANGTFTGITSPQQHLVRAVLILLLATGSLYALFKQIIQRSPGLNSHRNILVVLSLALLVRVIYWVMNPLPASPNLLHTAWPDEATYFVPVKHIVEHGYLSYLASVKSFTVAPGNPSYIAAIYSVSQSINVVRFCNLLLSVTSIWLVYRIGCALFSRRAALLAAIVCSLNSQLVTYSATFLTEPLFIFLLLGFVHFFIDALQSTRHQLIKAILASAMLAAASLTRTILLLLPLVLLLPLAWLAWRNKGTQYLQDFKVANVKMMMVSLLIPISFIGAVAIKNHFYFGKFAIATGSGAALWLGSRHDTEGDEPPYRGLQYDTTSITTTAFSHLSPEGDSRLVSAAKENIRKDPLHYLWICLKKPERLLIGNNHAWFFPQSNVKDWYTSSSGEILPLTKIVASIAMASFIAIFGALGAVYNRRAPLVVLTLIIPAGYFLVMSVPFLAIQRYGLPVFPLLALLAFAALPKMRKWHLFSALSLVVAVIAGILLGV